MTIVLRTIHGSRLYGLDSPALDWDYYQVVVEGETRQNIVDRQDVTTVTLRDFERFVSKGVPQALEALYSPVRWGDWEWQPYLLSLRPNYWETLQTYRRTIANFFAAGDRKRVRHGFRLTFNAEEFQRRGCFNPCLTPDEIQAINDLTDGYMEGVE